MRLPSFLKNKKDVLLWGIAAFLLILVIVYGGLSARFIARMISVLSESNLPKVPPIATFNLEKLNMILKEKGQLPPQDSPATSRP